MGREEARLEGERRLLRRLLETRFGPLSDDLRRRIETIGSADHLERLCDRSLEAASLVDLEPSD